MFHESTRPARESGDESGDEPGDEPTNVSRKWQKCFTEVAEMFHNFLY